MDLGACVSHPQRARFPREVGEGSDFAIDSRALAVLARLDAVQDRFLKDVGELWGGSDFQYVGPVSVAVSDQIPHLGGPGLACPYAGGKLHPHRRRLRALPHIIFLSRRRISRDVGFGHLLNYLSPRRFWGASGGSDFLKMLGPRGRHTTSKHYITV